MRSVLLMLVVHAGCAHRGPAPYDPVLPPMHVTVLRHVRVIDGTGAPPLEDVALVIEGVIASIVPSAEWANQKSNETVGIRILDLPGCTVIPGLVSDHSHVGLVDGTTADAKNISAANIARQLRQYVAYGVTTVTSLGFNGPDAYAARRGGHLGFGADLFVADHGIGVLGAAPPVAVGPALLYRPATVDEARAAVRESAARKPDLIKIWVDDFAGTQLPKMSPDIYRAVIDEAHRAHLRVAAHVFYLDDAKKLVEAGIDILAHGVRDLPVDDAFIAALKSHGTWYIPTLELDESFFVYAENPAWMQRPFFRYALQPQLAAQLDDPAWRQQMLGDAKKIAFERNALRINLENVRRLHAAGCKLGFGTDSGATPVRIPGFAEHRELALLVQAGLTPVEAIHVATSQAAALLGLEDRGVIARGRHADLLVVKGDPSRDIEDLSNIVSVWTRGEERTNPIAGTLSPR